MGFEDFPDNGPKDLSKEESPMQKEPAHPEISLGEIREERTRIEAEIKKIDEETESLISVVSKAMIEKDKFNSLRDGRSTGIPGIFRSKGNLTREEEKKYQEIVNMENKARSRKWSIGLDRRQYQNRLKELKELEKRATE
jgi:hypothetical protein